MNTYEGTDVSGTNSKSNGFRYLLFISFSFSIIALLFSGKAYAKPIYMTVGSSFSTQENPRVEVAFENHGPVELRILKPLSLDAFIKSQSNLRRAWKKPSTVFNPGHALSRGLNAVRSPDRFLLNAIDFKLRKELSSSLPNRKPETNAPLTKLAEGPAKLVQIPPEMKLIRSEWLNLDLGGQAQDFDVPGFSIGLQRSGFQERQVELAPLPAGLYLLQLVQGMVEGQVVMVVSDITAQIKQTDREILVRVAGRDQLPRANAEVTVFSPNGKISNNGKTNANGEIRLPVTDSKLLIKVTSGADVAIVDTDFYSTLAVTPDAYIYSDRPIYKPGDTVKFRGILRQPDSFLARLFSPSHREVTVQLVADTSTSANGSTRSLNTEVDEFGCFSGELRLPSNLEAGVFRISAQVDSQKHQAEARVQQYVKPTFYLEIASPDETVTPGQALRAKVKVRSYAGGTPAKSRYEFFLYRSLLDSPAWIDDAGMGGEGSEVTYGSTSTTEGMLSIPERLFSSAQQRISQGNGSGEDSWASAPLFNEQGEADVEIPVPQLQPGEERLPYKYTLSIRARDDQGTFANQSATFYLAPCEILGSVRPARKLVKIGSNLPIAIRATTLSGKSYAQASGKIEFVLRRADGSEKKLATQDFQVDAEGIWRGMVPAQEVGTVLARATLWDQRKQPCTAEASVLVIGNSSEPVAKVASLSVETGEGIVEPGDTAEVIALLPEGFGPQGKNQGPVWITLSGSKIFRTQMAYASNLTFVHRFAVEKQFGSAVYASLAYPTSSGRWEERTASFRIVPSQRTLRVTIQPSQLEVAPLGTQTVDLRVTDVHGKPVAAQVSLGVVDKAIYALQSEFRPRALDFFYPLGRNNVSTFYSTEFQGYGHGEQLAQMLAGAHKYAFSAIKPPVRQVNARDEDTAYWNSRIVTDQAGFARVSFPMPANQTLWVITAVAADASGRFGESTSEFASRGSMTLVASVPQFLREGDQASGSVRIAASEKASRPLSWNLSIANSSGLAGSEIAEKVIVEPGQEKIITFPLLAAQPSLGKIKLSGVGETQIKDQRLLPVALSGMQETVEVKRERGGKLALSLADGVQVESAELLLQPTLLDVMLTQVRELLDYPHGCLEQLVASTIPNLAVYQALNRVNALQKLDPQSQALLAEARSRSEQGLQQILSLSVKGGGFTWFHGYSTPSLPLTLIALDGLAHAVDAGALKRDDSRLVESIKWLESQSELPLEMEASRGYVLARLQGKNKAPFVRAMISRQAEMASPYDPYSTALMILAAKQTGVSDEPEMKPKMAKLVQSSQESFAMPANYTIDSQKYWDYPIRKAGLMAVVAHAAAKSPLDIALARRQLIDVLSSPNLSTFDRSTALLHSLWLIEKEAKDWKTIPAPMVTIDGKKPGVIKARGAGYAVNLPKTFQNAVIGDFDGVAILRAQVYTPLEKIQPQSQGMTIERNYYLLRQDQLKKLTPGEAINQGEEVFVELKINAHDQPNSSRSAYYVVEDAVPAGFVPLVEDKAWRGAPWHLPLQHEALRKRSLNPQKAIFYFQEPTWWSASPRMIGYVMRAQFAGQFAAPPATVTDMYAANVYARSASAKLVVR